MIMTVFHEWEPSDLEGRMAGKKLVFQNKTLSFCEHLTTWVRWGNYLIKYYDFLWFKGYNGDEFINKIEEIKALFEVYIKEYPIKKLAKDIENFSKNHKYRLFYAQCHDISKPTLDTLKDGFIEDWIITNM